MRCSACGAGYWREKITARITVQVESELVLGVHRERQIEGQRIDRILNGRNFLVTNLQLPRKLAASDLGRDICALRDDVLKAGKGICLCRKLKTLSANDERRAVRCGYRQAAVARIDLRNVDKA